MEQVPHRRGPEQSSWEPVLSRKEQGRSSWEPVPSSSVLAQSTRERGLHRLGLAHS